VDGHAESEKTYFQFAGKVRRLLAKGKERTALMGIFKKKPSPVMTEVWLVDLLKKFDSNRTPVDVIEMIMFISEGALPMNSNNHEPKFKNLQEFDASIREILGSLDEESFRSLVKMLLFEPEYLNRFISIAVNELEDTFATLSTGLDHEVPISADSVKRFSIITKKTTLLITELTQVVSDLSDLVSTESLIAIAQISGKSRDFSAQFLEELNRSMKYIEDFRNR
jgi:hypothetical protein